MTDARLLPPAVAVWVGALVTLLFCTGDAAERHARAVTVAASAGGGLVLLVGAVLMARVATRKRHVPVVSVLIVGGMVVGALTAGAHVAALSAQPVADWAQVRATSTVRATVNGEAVRRRVVGTASWQQRTRWEVPVTAREVCARGMCVEVDLPMVLRLPDATTPAPGSAVQVSGRLGPPPGPADGAAVVTAATDGIRIEGTPGWVATWIHAMRVGLLTALDGAPDEGGALVAGLSVGDESRESASLSDAMRASGLSHLTAVSGGNVAVVVVVVVGLATALGLSLMMRAVTAAIALLLLVILVGPQPSVLRAAVMGAVVLAGTLTGGRRSGPSVLATSVLVLVVVSPALARSWAFALSVGATAGLILLAPVIAEVLARWRVSRRWPPALREAVGITTAAQLATLPVLMLMGVAVGWVALPANLLAMPVVPVVTILGLAAALAAPLAPWLSAMIAHAASWPGEWIALVARTCAGLPLARIPWPTGALGVVLAASAVVIAWLLRRWSRRVFPAGVPRRVVVVGGVLAALTAGAWVAAPPARRAWPPSDWLFIMCDVGQGDALVLRSGVTSAVVVDTGPDPALVHACLVDAGVDDVPAVILTHFHADHVEGLPGVLDGHAVGAVLVTPVRDPPEEAAAVDRWLAGAGLHAEAITAGDARSVGGVSWRALWPRRAVHSGSVPNNASVVLAVQIGGRTLLLTGDIESEAQAAILPEVRDLRVDVVKVPHHGSRGQDPGFAAAASAPLALISVGVDNPYGHPAIETIASWQAAGALVERTDLNGDIAVVATASGVGVVTRGGP